MIKNIMNKRRIRYECLDIAGQMPRYQIHIGFRSISETGPNRMQKNIISYVSIFKYEKNCN